MGDDKNYTNVILEEIRSQMSAVLEIVSDNQRKLGNMPTREEFDDLKADVNTFSVYDILTSGIYGAAMFLFYYKI